MGSMSIQTPDFINHPTFGLSLPNEQEFFKRTHRIDYRGNQQTIDTGVLGTRKTFRIPPRGIVSEVRLNFSVTLVVGTAATWTILDKFLEGLVSGVRIKANNTDLVNANGMQLHDLRCIAADAGDFSDVESKTVSASTGTKTLDFTLVVPLSTDPTTIAGAVFAETDDTYLECEVTFETQAELATLTGGTTWAFSGVINPSVTAWSVPHVQTSKGLAAVLPDLSIHAMLGSRRTFIQANGPQNIQISRAQGQLLRAIWRTYDASAKAYVDPLSCTSIKFRYGQNQQLREHTTRELLFLNARWYRDILPRKALSLDFVAENSLRDVVVPGNVLDMEIVQDYGTTVTIEAGDYVEMLEQVVIPNPTWARSQPVDMAA